MSQEASTYEKENQTQTQVVAHGDYASNANYRTEISRHVSRDCWYCF